MKPNVLVIYVRGSRAAVGGLPGGGGSRVRQAVHPGFRVYQGLGRRLQCLVSDSAAALGSADREDQDPRQPEDRGRLREVVAGPVRRRKTRSVHVQAAAQRLSRTNERFQM